MYGGKDQEIYNELASILLVQLNDKIVSMRVEFTYDNTQSYTKIYAIQKNKKEFLITMTDFQENKGLEYEYEVLKIPNRLRDLRNIMKDEKGAWEKCFFTIHNTKKFDAEFVYKD